MQRFNDSSLLCLSFAINGCWLAAGFFKTLFQLPRLYSVKLDKKNEQVNDMPKKIYSNTRLERWENRDRAQSSR
jgi:hypothetical protein